MTNQIIAHRCNQDTRRPGFTLVELLVVIGIIALLISILMPALGRAKGMAVQIQCKSNMKQLGLGLMIYQQDNKGILPGSQVGGTQIWPSQIRKTLNCGEKPFYCPAADPRAQWVPIYDNSQPEQWGYKAGERRLGGGEWFSIGINDWGTREFDDGATPPGHHLGAGGEMLASNNDTARACRWAWIKKPSDFIVMADTTEDGVWDTIVDSKNPASYYKEFCKGRHFGRCDVLFADGHVETMSLRQLIQPSVAADQRRWHNDNEPHSNLFTYHDYVFPPGTP